MLRKLTGATVWLALVFLAVATGADDAKNEQPAAKASDGEAVLLRWKVPDGKALGLKTAMFPVDPASTTLLRFDFKKLAEGHGLPPIPDDAIATAFRMPQSYSMTTLLKPLPGGNLSAKIIVGDVQMPGGGGSEVEQTTAELMKQMEGTVQLRGEITDSGQVASFWLEQKQKNLLAVFLELPTAPVKVGQSWSLSVNFLEMGSGFICDKSGRANSVKLVSLSKTAGGDTVATMEYCLAESIEGKFRLPTGGADQPCTMAMSFVGRGEFLVGKGTWQRFVGRMHIKATGVMTSDAQQHFAMEPMAEVPAKLLEME